MNAQTVKAHLAERGKLVEEHLRGCVADPGTPERLREAMLYSLLAGGKRFQTALPPALAYRPAGVNDHVSELTAHVVMPAV